MNVYTQESLAKLREDRTTHEKRMEELLAAKAEGGFTTEQREEFNGSRDAIARSGRPDRGDRSPRQQHPHRTACRAARRTVRIRARSSRTYRHGSRARRE